MEVRRLPTLPKFAASCGVVKTKYSLMFISCAQVPVMVKGEGLSLSVLDFVPGKGSAILADPTPRTRPTAESVPSQRWSRRCHPHQSKHHIRLRTPVCREGVSGWPIRRGCALCRTEPLYQVVINDRAVDDRSCIASSTRAPFRHSQGSGI